MQLDAPATFFLACPLDFEELALRELLLKWPSVLGPLPAPTLGPGGLTLSAPLAAVAFLNQGLKIPTRVYLNLTDFKCRDFPRLFQKIQKLPWREWLLPGVPEITCASHQSRLFDSRKIQSAVLDGLALYWKANPSKKELLERALKAPPAQLLVRLEDDICHIRLDTSGERLGLRGEKVEVGEAPLRENLAAGLLMFLRETVGADGPLVDPMCGSGTFPIEALSFGRLSVSRDYAYRHLPIFQGTPLAQELHCGPLFAPVLGLDRDPQMAAKAARNAASAELAQENSAFLQGDALDGAPAPSQAQAAVLALNPPYGIRLGRDEVKGAELDYYTALLIALVKKYRPTSMGVLIPSAVPGEKLAKLAQLKVRAHMSFKHGGLPVTWWVLGP